MTAETALRVRLCRVVENWREELAMWLHVTVWLAVGIALSAGAALLVLKPLQLSLPALLCGALFLGFAVAAALVYGMRWSMDRWP